MLIVSALVRTPYHFSYYDLRTKSNATLQPGNSGQIPAFASTVGNFNCGLVELYTERIDGRSEFATSIVSPLEVYNRPCCCLVIIPLVDE